MVETGIGYFGDARLERNGALIVQRVAERQEVCVRKLGDDRPEHAKIRRFLRNEAVTVEEMVAYRAGLAAAAAAASGRHVLAIQDEVTGTGLAVRWMRLDGDRSLHQLLDAGERGRVARGGALVVAEQKSHDAQKIVLHKQSLNALRGALRELLRVGGLHVVQINCTAQCERGWR